MRDVPSAVRKQIILGTEFPDAVEAMVRRCQSTAEISWLNNSMWTALDALHWKTQLELSKKQSDRVEEFHSAEGGNEMGHGAGDAEISEAAEGGGEALRADPPPDAGPAAPELPGDRGHEGTGAVGDG